MVHASNGMLAADEMGRKQPLSTFLLLQLSCVLAALGLLGQSGISGALGVLGFSHTGELFWVKSVI